MTFQRCLEMSVSREEFLRLLPAVVPDFELDGDVIRWSREARRGAIRLISLPDRLVGSVAIDRHLVEITLDECPTVEAEAFMARFHRAFLRGGG